MSKPRTPKHVPQTKWERLYRELEAEQNKGAEAVALKLIEQQGGNPRLDHVRELTTELATKLPCSVQYMQTKAQLDQAIAESLLPDREELIEHLDYVAVWCLENWGDMYERINAKLEDLLLLRARLMYGMSYHIVEDGDQYCPNLEVTMLGDEITFVPTEKHLGWLAQEVHEAAMDE